MVEHRADCRVGTEAKVALGYWANEKKYERMQGTHWPTREGVEKRCWEQLTNRAYSRESEATYGFAELGVRAF